MLLSTRRRCLRASALLTILAALALMAYSGSSPAGAQEQPTGPLVDVLQIDGALDSRVTAHIERALDRAEADGAELLVLELSTRGGLGTDGVELAARVRSSAVPVVVWIGPPGTRVTGAGVLIAQAAHVLAMAPATVLGAASPPDLADPGSGADPGMLAEAAEAMGRDGRIAAMMADGEAVVALGPQTAGSERVEVDPAALPWAVDHDRVAYLHDDDLIAAGAASLVAVEFPDLLRGADGLTVPLLGAQGEVAGERTIDVDPLTVHVRFDNLGLLDRVLHAMADPTLVYLLLIGGALAILFEVYQPGFGVAGGAGVLILGLAAYGLWVLPVSIWALALVAVGLALLAVDLAIAGLGLLTVSGTTALAAGSYWLFDGPPPLQPSRWALVAGVAFCVLYFVVIMTMVLRAQGAQAMAGAERVIGLDGVVRSMLNPEGHVYVDGALWRARAPEGAGKVKTGTPVRVVGMSDDGLSLEVELVETSREAAANRV